MRNKLTIPIFVSLFILTAALVLSSCGASRKGSNKLKEASEIPAYERRTSQGESPGEVQDGVRSSPDSTTLNVQADDTSLAEITEREQTPTQSEIDDYPEEPAQKTDNTGIETIPAEDDIPYDEEPAPQEEEQGEPMTETADSTAAPGSVPAPSPAPVPEDTAPEASATDESRKSKSDEATGTKVVDFEADVMRPINITDDSTALLLLGNVVLYHNGAVITCDSAVRYSEKRMDCFRRVVINNNTTYIYGDRAEYNGEINTARVYSPIVKVVDEDAVLYTYNFRFNTLTEIGQYSGGGTLTQGDNRLESLRGYYDTDTREFTAVGDVELTNPDYKLISDSVRYNLDTELAEFFVTSHIWNSKGEILIADRGQYNNATEDYDFTSNSYVLSENQEIWADSLKYRSVEDNTILRRDIQIIDEENNTLAFGDYGEYWGQTEHGMLTVNPSLLSFDPEEPDTLYMRSDSMFFYTFDINHVFDQQQAEATARAASEFPAEELIEMPARELPDSLGSDTTAVQGLGRLEQLRSTMQSAGSGRAAASNSSEISAVGEDEEFIGTAPGGDSSPPSGEQTTRDSSDKPDTGKRRRRDRRNETSVESEITNNAPPAEITQEPAVEQDEESVDEISEDRLVTDLESADNDPEREGIETEDEVVSEPLTTEETDGEEEGPETEPEIYVNPYSELTEILYRRIAADSIDRDMTPEQFWIAAQKEMEEDSLKRDYYIRSIEEVMTGREIDSLGVAVPEGNFEDILETVITESQTVVASYPGLQEPQDSVQRVFFGYRDVRIFREDFQAVCDSIVGFSRDSTLHLHIDPVMWSDQNQVVSDVMILYSQDEQLYKAEFYGTPFMSSEVDETRYNQIKGKFMVSWFRDNDIYMHEVFGNGQTYYYMEDDDTGDIDGFMTCESADIVFFIDEKTIDKIKYIGEPVYWIYPIDKVPDDVDQFLPGFKWEAERRPLTKEDVFDRIIRPSRREEVTAIPQPTFPITDNIERAKERLTQQNLWRDRNDTLSPQALEFMRYIELRDAEQQLNR